MQSDLFNFSLSNSLERQVFQKTFFERKFTLRVDQLLGAALVMIVFFVLVFAWGVEHGKAVSHRDMLFQSTKSETEAAPVVPVAVDTITPPVESLVIPKVAPVVEVATPVNSITEIEPTQSLAVNAKYTIAHIIYLRKDQASREAQKIESKGQKATIVPNGKYFQICVGGFATRKEATEGMKALQSQGIVSKDAYIRNVTAG